MADSTLHGLPSIPHDRLVEVNGELVDALALLSATLGAVGSEPDGTHDADSRIVSFVCMARAKLQSAMSAMSPHV